MPRPPNPDTSARPHKGVPPLCLDMTYHSSHLWSHQAWPFIPGTSSRQPRWLQHTTALVLKRIYELDSFIFLCFHTSWSCQPLTSFKPSKSCILYTLTHAPPLTCDYLIHANNRIKCRMCVMFKPFKGCPTDHPSHPHTYPLLVPSNHFKNYFQPQATNRAN